jgi:uncharacterized protein YciI
MKNFLLLFGYFVLSSCNSNPDQQEKTGQTQETRESMQDSASYDSGLARSLGADQYGMKQYVMAFLKAGPQRDQDSIQAAKIQAAHLANISRLAAEGLLVVAGPFMDNDSIRGIYIFNVQSLEEAEKLIQTDPAIQAGRLKMELRPWYGSAALMKVNEIHETLQQSDF